MPTAAGISTTIFSSPTMTFISIIVICFVLFLLLALIYRSIKPILRFTPSPQGTADDINNKRIRTLVATLRQRAEHEPENRAGLLAAADSLEKEPRSVVSHVEGIPPTTKTCTPPLAPSPQRPKKDLQSEGGGSRRNSTGEISHVRSGVLKKEAFSAAWVATPPRKSSTAHLNLNDTTAFRRMLDQYTQKLQELDATIAKVDPMNPNNADYYTKLVLEREPILQNIEKMKTGIAFLEERKAKSAATP